MIGNLRPLGPCSVEDSQETPEGPHSVEELMEDLDMYYSSSFLKDTMKNGRH